MTTLSVRFLVDNDDRLQISLLDCISRTWEITPAAARQLLARSTRSKTDLATLDTWCCYYRTPFFDYAYSDTVARFLLSHRKGDTLWRSENTLERWKTCVESLRACVDPFPVWAARLQVLRERPFRLNDTCLAPPEPLPRVRREARRTLRR